MSTVENLKTIKKQWHGTLKSYVIGFIGSVVLTGASFTLAWTQFISGHTLIYLLVGLGILQAFLQLKFFLHIGSEPKPQWESLIFLFTVMVLLIIVLGSLWVMHDLDYRMMPEMMEAHSLDKGAHFHD